MQHKLHLLDPKIRLNLLVSSLVFALFVLVMLNVTFSITTITTILEFLDVRDFHLNFTNGYFTVNQQTIGFPLLINFFSFFLVWYLVFHYTKKSILKNV